MVFNVTLNNISAISWRSVLLVVETRVLRENHRTLTSQWQTFSHNVVCETRTHNISGDRHRLHRSSCKSNYHTISATAAPIEKVDTMNKIKVLSHVFRFLLFVCICIAVGYSNQDLDFNWHMSWSVICLMTWGEESLFVTL